MDLDSLFQVLGQLSLEDEGDVLVCQSYTRYTLLGYMRARKIKIPGSILLLIPVAVYLQDAIVAGLTWIS